MDVSSERSNEIRGFMETSSNLRVRNTFIDFEDKASAALGGSRSDVLRRASSDSALYETCASEMQRMDDEVDDQQVEFDLAGLSDAETDTDELPALLCYSHINEVEEDMQPDVSAFCSPALAQREGALARDANLEQSALESRANVPALARKSQAPPAVAEPQLECNSQVDVDRLMSENNRLALENRLLRENMRLTLENRRLAETAEARSIKHKASERAVEQHVRPQRNSATCAPTWWTPPAAQSMPPLAAGPVRTSSKTTVMAPVFHEETRMASKQTPNSDHMQGGRAMAADECMECELPEAERTTVMLRNLPNNYSRAMLLGLLGDEGFAGKYDFMYLPIDFKSRACLGYAFINFLSPTVVPAFWKTFHGYSRWILPSKKVSCVSWSGPHQGFEAHVSRYRNSPVMHDSVPDEYKPVIFFNGIRMCFPPPTKSPRAPRVRNHPPSKGSKAGTR